MFVKIPFESNIEFKTNISEITKMSLEHDYNINDKVVLGNFYISGEYKVHAVSVNKEEFKYTLPFTVDLRNDINPDTLEFNIEDFSYEVVNNNVLKVKIEYSLAGELKEEKEELFERVDENELEDELEYIDNFLDKDEKEELEVKEEEKKSEERINAEEEKTVLDTINSSDDTFVTYHVHVVKESESLDSIASIYNVPKNLLEEYNNIDTLTIGDKVLIPKVDE